MILLTNRKTAGALVPKEPKRKTIIKDLKMDPHYGHHINPISRLIQVMQSKKEPVFRLVKEQGQNRYKEFTFEITCRGVTLTGSGPNKKLAKRAAAEAMLEHIGYVKPMPQPGKSLLKKKSIDGGTSPTIPAESVDIGVFDPTECLNDDSNQSSRSNSSILETFADVDNSLVAPEEPPKSPQKSVTVVVAPEEKEEIQAEPIRKRRVTFSNQVSACPPPEDSKYPEASIAPLKSEVVIVSKLKKRKSAPELNTLHPSTFYRRQRLQKIPAPRRKGPSSPALSQLLHLSPS